MKETINVLFTAVGGWPTHATINSLRRSERFKYKIVGVDINDNPATRTYCDIVYKVSRCNSPEYIYQLLSICRHEQIDVIVPLISEDIPPIYKNLSKFEAQGVKVLLSDADSRLLIANDKLELYKFLESRDLRVMPTTFEYDSKNLDDILERLGYPHKPIAVKLKDSCGGTGFKILDEKMAMKICTVQNRTSRSNPYITKDQLVEIGEDGRHLLQTYLGGRELGVLSLVDKGRTIYSLCHDNYDMQYATTTDCELVRDYFAESVVRELNSILKLDGNIGYDFKRDDSGNLYLLEINPRISATVVLAVEAGVNIVEMGILHKLGIEIDENIEPLYGLRMKRVYGTIFTYKGEPYGQ